MSHRFSSFAAPIPGSKAVFAAILGVALAAASSAQSTRYRDITFDDVVVTRDVVYGVAVHSELRIPWPLLLDVYEPQGDRASTRPAVVIVHGGGFVTGRKDEADIARLARDFARRGFVAVSIDYRLWSGRGRFTRRIITDAMHDTKAAIRFVRRFAHLKRIDPRRIACMGPSAGGVTTCETAYVPGEGNSGSPGWPSDVQAIAVLWGAIWDERDLEAGEAPVLVVHGTRDYAIPFSYGQRIKARADRVGVPAVLEPIPGASHEPWKEYFRSYHQRTVDFFYEHLRLGELSGLVTRRDSRTTLTIGAFGVAADRIVVLGSLRPSHYRLPGLGTVCLDPTVVRVVLDSMLPTGRAIAGRQWTMDMRPGIHDALYWQAVAVSPEGAIRWITNCERTDF